MQMGHWYYGMLGCYKQHTNVPMSHLYDYTYKDGRWDVGTVGFCNIPTLKTAELLNYMF